MRINRAIGMGVGILILQWLMSEVFFSFERTVVATFDTTQTVLGVVERGIATTSTASLINVPIP